MDREGRVLVTRFAYSSMKTIPKVILTSTLVKKTNPKILPNVKSHVWPYGHGDKVYNGSHFSFILITSHSGPERIQHKKNVSRNLSMVSNQSGYADF